MNFKVLKALTRVRQKYEGCHITAIQSNEYIEHIFTDTFLPFPMVLDLKQPKNRLNVVEIQLVVDRPPPFCSLASVGRSVGNRGKFVLYSGAFHKSGEPAVLKSNMKKSACCRENNCAVQYNSRS